MKQIPLTQDEKQIVELIFQVNDNEIMITAKFIQLFLTWESDKKISMLQMLKAISDKNKVISQYTKSEGRKQAMAIREENKENE